VYEPEGSFMGLKVLLPEFIQGHGVPGVIFGNSFFHSGKTFTFTVTSR